uniref:Uncharacterized protein n=1 Tax=Oryza sativa subsp. japonica TaxID=39947 RepID=Q6Z1N8_ORYSJ|nr:hypothetical protein [Oryza sativa Japonica Group]
MAAAEEEETAAGSWRSSSSRSSSRSSTPYHHSDLRSMTAKYNIDTHPYEHMHVYLIHPILMSIFEDWASKSWRLTRSHHRCLAVDGDLRCY